MNKNQVSMSQDDISMGSTVTLLVAIWCKLKVDVHFTDLRGFWVLGSCMRESGCHVPIQLTTPCCTAHLRYVLQAETRAVHTSGDILHVKQGS